MHYRQNLIYFILFNFFYCKLPEMGFCRSQIWESQYEDVHLNVRKCNLSNSAFLWKGCEDFHALET